MKKNNILSWLVLVVVIINSLSCVAIMYYSSKTVSKIVNHLSEQESIEYYQEEENYYTSTNDSVYNHLIDA